MADSSKYLLGKDKELLYQNDPATDQQTATSELDPTQPYLGLIQKYRPQSDQTDINAQRKIAKGNALAEAFRIMIDAAGGSRGANISKRDINNPVMKAVDNYYKMKEADKAEQTGWDRAELGAGLDALKTKSSQEFASKERKTQQEFAANQTKGQQEFASGQADKEREFRAGEGEKARTAEAGKLKQQADQFRQELGLKSRAQTEETATKYAQIEAQRERYRNMYPYGRTKGMIINDTDIEQQVLVPDDKKQQVLAFIQKDAAVQNEIPILKMRYGNVGNDATTDFLIADLYPALSPGTREQIRKFLGASQPAGKAGAVPPGAQSLLNTSMPRSAQTQAYDPNKGPIAPASQPQPTIKVNKGSTVVQVSPAATSPSSAQLSPEQVQQLQKGLQNPNYTPEQKRSAVYNYLIKQGYDSANAKELAEAAYQSLIGK